MIERFYCKKKRKIHFFHRIYRPVILLLVALSITFFLINSTLSPIIVKIAAQKSSLKIEQDFFHATYPIVGKNAVSYDEIFTVSYMQDGSIAAMNVNMAACYNICAEVIPSLTEKARSYTALSVSVPLGTLSGIPAFSGKGPVCTVKVILNESVRVRIESQFVEAGINQTLHKIFMVTTASITLLVPGNPTDVTTEVRIPLTETVLLGKVPDAYTEIHRLTDDITEEDIDDIYDFGAQNSK